VLLLILSYIHFYAQSNSVDSLLNKVSLAKSDSEKVELYIQITNICEVDDIPKYVESGIKIAEKGNYKKGIHPLLGNLGFYYTMLNDYNKAIVTLLEAETKILEINNPTKSDKKSLGVVYGNIGSAYYFQGNLKKSSDYFYKKIEIFEALDDKYEASLTLHNLSVMFVESNELDKGLKYALEGLKLREALNDSVFICESLILIANIYNRKNLPDKAVEYINKALNINKSNKINEYAIYMGLGEAYRVKSDYSKALEYINQSLDISINIKDAIKASDSYFTIGNVNMELKNFKIARTNYLKAYDFAKKLGNPILISKIAQALSNCFEKEGDFSNALLYSRIFKNMSDSITNLSVKKSGIQKDMQYDFDKKEALAKADQDKKDALAFAEIKRKNLQRNASFGGLSLMMLLAIVFFTQRNRISKEKDISENLLLNILPYETAQELKAKGSADAKLIDHVTVLFTDFKGFTAMAEKLSPQELVADLNVCFSEFDRIMEKYGIEKIKTIGDSYMAAGGLPTPNDTHATDVVKAAFEIAQFIEEGKQRKLTEGLPYFEIRIGIHTGPVVAGIVGIKKFSYDIWGDTVNTASRMESSGEIGKVNISETTYELVKNEFNCEFRGEVEAKGKGMVKMYFVGGLIHYK
jgi:class 3 adenylate cyclase